MGGVTVIASVVAILALIVGVTVPLFRPPRAEVVGTCRVPKILAGQDVVNCGVDLDMDGTAATGFLWTGAARSSW